MSYLQSYWGLADNFKLIACWEHSQNTAVSDPISQQQIEITFIMRSQCALDGHTQECGGIVVCAIGVWVYFVYLPVRATGSKDLKPRKRDERDLYIYISAHTPVVGVVKTGSVIAAIWGGNI